MRILFSVQGRYGERAAENIRANGPKDWTALLLRLPPRLPMVIDDPEEILPASVPEADLLVSLHETPGAAELIPDIAKQCGAKAVLAAVDDRAACPPGLENQVRKRLDGMGIASAFPRPFCGFDGAKDERLSAFAERFGRPKFTVHRGGDRVSSVEVLRDAPCGSAKFVASVLRGVRLSEAADTGALRHHHHPCLASMAIDPDLQDTIMHLSGYIVRAALKAAMRGDKDPG